MWTVEHRDEAKPAPSAAPLEAATRAASRPDAAPHFVLIEDNPAESRLFERRMRERDSGARITVVRDGENAIDLLDQVVEGTVPRPDLLILDLNLPVLKGWQVLRYVKRSPMLRFLKVVILSSSKTEADVARAARDGAASYVHKGRDLDDMLGAVDEIYDFWLGLGSAH